MRRASTRRFAEWSPSLSFAARRKKRRRDISKKASYTTRSKSMAFRRYRCGCSSPRPTTPLRRTPSTSNIQVNVGGATLRRDWTSKSAFETYPELRRMRTRSNKFETKGAQKRLALLKAIDRKAYVEAIKKNSSSRSQTGKRSKERATRSKNVHVHKPPRLYS